MAAKTEYDVLKTSAEYHIFNGKKTEVLHSHVILTVAIEVKVNLIYRSSCIHYLNPKSNIKKGLFAECWGMRYFLESNF
jgi:hypothetical protein